MQETLSYPAQERILFKDLFILMVSLDSQCFFPLDKKKKTTVISPKLRHIPSAQHNSQHVACV